MTQSDLLSMTRADFDTKASNMIGAQVILNHTTKTVPWTIIGYNHDGTSYTFDLMSSVSMYDNTGFGGSEYYGSSYVRTTINNMVSGFGSDIQNRLQTMNVVSSGYINNDKVKLLSLTEMGITSGDGHPGVEGNTYSGYFTTGRSIGRYGDLIRNSSSGSVVDYWTRSRYTNASQMVFCIADNGNIYKGGLSDTHSYLPVIRISIPA